jgi:lipid-binding SYLF domain-containing protein
MLITLPVVSFAGLFGDDKTPDQQRAEIGEMRDKTLTRLYKEEPDAKAEIAKAVGYAVFDNTGIHILLVSTGFGAGIAHDNGTGKDTYMKMYTGGVGPGLGVKDYRVIFVFHTREKFDKFLNEGWSAEGQADAAATTGEKGGEASGAVEVPDGVSIYQLTEKGLALQLTIQGTKYSKNDELN